MSYKVATKVINEPQWNYNGLRFATPEEAQTYGDGLLDRWSLAERVEVQTSPDPVNYRLVDGQPVKIEENPPESVLVEAPVEQPPAQSPVQASSVVYNEDYTGPRWRYGLQYRPPTFGGAPNDFIIFSDRKDPRFANFGTIDYPRQLTEDEVRNYELVPVEITETTAVEEPVLEESALPEEMPVETKSSKRKSGTRKRKPPTFGDGSSMVGILKSSF